MFDARRLVAVALLFACGLASACGPHRGPSADRTANDADRDGLDDGLEASLAASSLPIIHEFGDAATRDGCPWPDNRPILYRARMLTANGRAYVDNVAITYVLLYVEDCGPLGHTGDNEAFTVFVHRDPEARWRTAGAVAIAHQGTPAERRSSGSGREIWVSRNKHSVYADFDTCVADDWIVDVCSKDGPAPAAHTFLNVGEPDAPLSNDVSDVMRLAGADPLRAHALAPWFPDAPDEASTARLIDTFSSEHLAEQDQIDLAYLLFRHHGIWNHQSFLGAGDITSQLFHPDAVFTGAEVPDWPAETEPNQAPRSQ